MDRLQHIQWVVVFGCVMGWGCSGRDDSATTTQVRRGPMVISHVYEASLESRHTEVISAMVPGGAALTELAEEGRFVQAGEVLARFDDERARRDVLRLSRDAELARLELETLREATLPLEVDEYEARLAQIKVDWDIERGLHEDFQEMARDDLMSVREVEQQRFKMDRMANTLAKMEREFDLTLAYNHPSRLARAEATQLAAIQELSLASQRLDRCVIVAPTAGMVMHTPLHVGTEYRAARVGDTLMFNQAFMALPDVGDWVTTFHVPEVELSHVAVGAPVRVTPLAYPGFILTGRVERISTTAQEAPGLGSWLKHFRVVAAVAVPDAVQSDLRPGMSARLHVVSYETPETLLVLRTGIRVVDGVAMAEVKRWRGREARVVTVGRMSRSEVEILEGLAEGDEVIIE